MATRRKCCNDYTVTVKRGVTTYKHSPECPKFKQRITAMGSKPADITGREKAMAVNATKRSGSFFKLDPDVQADLLEWAEYTYDDWAVSFINDITAGEMDSFVGRIAKACNERMALVFKPTSEGHRNDDELTGKLTRYEQMKLAGQIVSTLGLKQREGAKLSLGVTNENYIDIIDTYGVEYTEHVKSGKPPVRLGQMKKEAEKVNAPKSPTGKRIVRSRKAADTTDTDVIDTTATEVPVKKQKAAPAKKAPAKATAKKERFIMAKSVQPGDVIDGQKVKTTEKSGTSSHHFTFTDGTSMTRRSTTKLNVLR